ncbi:MAG: ribonuclease III [Methanobrevibacter sp.]|uniref:ribonuclease III n=1 Tax=Methanobrevibacter sp. TaxID=66852 RepID=UPI0025EC2D84|nr:ribonuclease III [Methanobrevibacter sp.]MBE6508755.1 ribonuclease III [Methanobrevibacter sp.]
MNLFEKFNIKTENEYLYDVAFTHGSYSTKYRLDYNYERLEFLGDSVLSLIVSEYLYGKYPHYEEGKLTKLRANYVCQSALIYYSHELGLQEYLKVAEEESNLTKNEILSITADIFESFLGAIFLDQGMEFAKDYVSKIIFKYIDENKIFFADYKSAMKEYGDAKDLEITYEVLDEQGVPHDKIFTMAILIDGQEMGIGKGKNKKEAEQAAAKVAIKKLNIKVF